MGKPKTRKKGWKRLARDPDQQVDEALRRARVAQAPDAELFFEDVAGHQCQLGPKKVEPLDETTLTVRQRAALKYRRERAELIIADIKKEEQLDDAMDHDGNNSKQHRKKAKKEFGDGVKIKKERVSTHMNEEKPAAKKGKDKKPNYDLWDEPAAVEVQAGQNASNKLSAKKTFTKKLPPRYVPSVLPAVVVPHEGASYNPPLASYLDYVDQIAKEEARELAKESRVERGLKADSVTESFNPCLQYFSNYSDGEDDDETDEEELEEKAEATKPPQVRPKTAKQRRRQAFQRGLEEAQRTEKRVRAQVAQNFSSLRTLAKQVGRRLRERQVAVTRRHAVRAQRALTERKRLGRGRFEPQLEPVLLTDELTSTLRQLRPQGNIFQERVNSLQRRNMLPIAGPKAPPKLKAKLRERQVESRAARSVTADSRVIN